MFARVDDLEDDFNHKNGEDDDAAYVYNMRYMFPVVELVRLFRTRRRRVAVLCECIELTIENQLCQNKRTVNKNQDNNNQLKTFKIKVLRYSVHGKY